MEFCNIACDKCSAALYLPPSSQMSSAVHMTLQRSIAVPRVSSLARIRWKANEIVIKEIKHETAKNAKSWRDQTSIFGYHQYSHQNVSTVIGGRSCRYPKVASSQVISNRISKAKGLDANPCRAGTSKSLSSRSGIVTKLFPPVTVLPHDYLINVSVAMVVSNGTGAGTNIDIYFFASSRVTLGRIATQLPE